ncbi:MAG: diaminopimelate epimerase [Rickettsiales bacterium]
MLVAQNQAINMLKFIKMNALGNDFIIIDQRFKNNLIEISPASIKKLCDRKNIGCDQLIIIKNADKFDVICQMLIYNQDGTESATCGNATRCVAGLIFSQNPNLDFIKIQTKAGILDAKKISNKIIKVNLGSPKILKENLNLEGFNFYHCDIGNPHSVAFVAELPNDDIFFQTAPKIEANTLIFPNKTNVEFAKICDDSKIEVRVFERGVGETLACGSGACAVAFTAIILQKIKTNITTIAFKGGNLQIEFDGKNIFMIGDYNQIFEGIIDEDFL